MQEINLTQGRVALVDDDDFDYICRWKWYAWYNTKTKSFYAVRMDVIGTKRVSVYMHRVIANTPKGLVTDHINHDTLNNCKYNLRVVSYAQNNINRVKQKSNTSGVVGVQRNGSGWVASISKDYAYTYGKTRRLKEDAINDRKKLEASIFGDYAYKKEEV